ncbi:Aste57867_836 [Aphanomyces stellatus]|uniref:Aste57867_836 protein n=1 Tax=Aphanomyces stellatus TaxID=120398 RepID=A0A485K4U9_9STRA|nr:hypothetical protein As57867_000835 [Aphanomyces stellatus]VFT78060.1 Aste57867_836 [Aphanomyces stellatus]
MQVRSRDGHSADDAVDLTFDDDDGNDDMPATKVESPLVKDEPTPTIIDEHISVKEELVAGASNVDVIITPNDSSDTETDDEGLMWESAASRRRYRAAVKTGLWLYTRV